ncbi:phage holin family protein [Parerythrobacter jejuensis]|uniref:Phage holin family protein n=1 Tax=Parerythrobacter jejuensis TaxID=795812 RepID=A0A845APQ8_9SPHN|nr:phage holin family protein [Parerythrobacter jejuensis]MXP32290.1 phage holin family protein [Parerythrobacter jejuensis]
MLDDAARDAQPDTLEPVSTPRDAASDPPFGSLADDVSALIEDGKTYVDAEIAFQKSRAGFAGKKTKGGVIAVLGAFAFLHLALIGLVVGLIIALEPYLTAFGAVATVVGVLLLGVAIFGGIAVSRFKAVSEAFKSETDEQA